MKKIILILELILVLGVIGCRTQEKNELQNIYVRLKWVHRAQFAGLYAAKEKGFYETAGLNVSLVPFEYGELPIDFVVEGKADFGITGADELLLAREKNHPVRAIAVIYKRNPVALYSLKGSGIEKPEDLKGKRVGIEKGINVEYMYRAMLSNLGIDASEITEVIIGYDDTELINNITDVSSGYVINEPQLAIEKGYEVNIIMPEDYGVNVYADVIIASEDMIENNPELVKKFLDATLAGWQHAIENEEEAVDIIMKYADESTREHQKNMLSASMPLINTGNSPLGWMDREKWRASYNILRKNNVLGRDFDVEQAYTMEFLS